MNREEILQKLNSEKYDFLRTNEHLGNNICLLTVGGSHAYGTNIATSDLDIRGFALEVKRNLLTGNKFEQVINEPTDTTIYSFGKLVSLLSNCNPNVIEMLGCRKEDYFYLSPVGQALIDNRNLFLSKAAFYSFGGYASAQLRRLDNKTARSISKEENEVHILKRLEEMNTCEDIELSVGVPAGKEEAEVCITVNLKNVSFRDFYAQLSILHGTVNEYDKNSMRNKKAAEHGKIAKHMMHLLRLYMMAIDILKDGQIITYREKEHDLLMSIRNGDYLDENKQPTAEFFALVKAYENEMQKAKERSDLPQKPDYKAIENFMLKIYDEYVFGDKKNSKLNIK